MIYYYLLAVLIVILDQASKWMVANWMELGESIPLVEGFLYLTSHRNQGAAFGILQGQQWLFVIVTLFVVGGILVYLWRVKNKWLLSVSLSLVLGGAVGNFIDRITTGEVVDFIDVRIFTYNYPIFNVADSAVVIGVAFLIWDTFRSERKKQSA